ncbi:MAG: bifunctional alpha,alpha-trehalose-phosphate synthase (UDP-forming)/trehalose-phosphatase [Verrucomicrobia bacterium]|nr:bifunctional alpha,alpha-trehalose-phosphate synthase (UDP-forming)/trehalose-phosphatase [Verrucomicrobiota bacterium]
MATTLINVSNRLPVTVKDGQITRSSGGLVAALEGLPKEQFAAKWIGWPGAAFDEESQRTVAQKLSGEYGSLPVFLSEEEVAGFYEGFSNSSLWPLLHYLPNFLRYEPAWWEQYQQVNELFAKKVLEIANPGDLVWVHDYHLMLVPAILRAAAPKFKIGFFLHTPFPAHEIFRCHPRRRELAAGILGANLIGFHAFGYLRHFCGSVRRILRLETELTHIATEDHTAALGVYPIGINALKFQETLESQAFRQRRQQFRHAHEGKRLIVSVERMDYTKGILHRLEAIDIFLSKRGQTDEARFIFVSVPSREGIEEYKHLVSEVESRVGQLNGKYGTLLGSPIHFIHGSIPFVDLCALYATADIAVVTPLVDGMNLVAKEFVGCQQENAGLLILSEFAGAAEELFNAIMVNPYDSAAVADAIEQALEMPIAERRSRALPMRDHVFRYDARHWARTFIKDLGSIAVDKPRTGAESIQELEQRLASLAATGKRVALFLDYDGTLREIEREPGAAIPTDAVISLLDCLGQKPNLEVTVLSGRSQSDLEGFLGNQPIRLVAEHGAAWRLPGSKEWERLDKNLNYSWKEKLLPILRNYQQSTPGSSIEDKHSSIVWHYRKAEEEFGAWKANRLTQELAALTANHPIKVIHGKKMVEVSALENNKGAVVKRVVEQDGTFDAVCCAGDDITDETMFELPIPNLFSIKVGPGRTQARFRVSDPQAFRQLLARVFMGKEKSKKAA